MLYLGYSCFNFWAKHLQATLNQNWCHLHCQFDKLQDHLCGTPLHGWGCFQRGLAQGNPVLNVDRTVLWAMVLHQTKGGKRKSLSDCLCFLPLELWKCVEYQSWDPRLCLFLGTFLSLHDGLSPSKPEPGQSLSMICFWHALLMLLLFFFLSFFFHFSFVLWSQW